jgi:hypothetical protein
MILLDPVWLLRRTTLTGLRLMFTKTIFHVLCLHLQCILANGTIVNSQAENA